MFLQLLAPIAERVDQREPHRVLDQAIRNYEMEENPTIKQSDYPNVLRLFEKLEADPAVAFSHAIEDERPANSVGGFRGHVVMEELGM